MQHSYRGHSFETSNLNRQRFYKRDIRKNKAVAMARNLKQECIVKTEMTGYGMNLEEAAEDGTDLACDVVMSRFALLITARHV